MVSKRFCDICGAETTNTANVKVSTSVSAKGEITYNDVCDEQMKAFIDALFIIGGSAPSSITIDLGIEARKYWDHKVEMDWNEAMLGLRKHGKTQE